MPRKVKCTRCNKVCHSRLGTICRACITETRGKDSEYRKKYARAWQLNKKYGMSLEEFDNWWIIFKGECGICRKGLIMPTTGAKGQALHTAVVDHNHTTRFVRGILCNGCNKGIGSLQDNPQILKAAYYWVGGE